MKLFDNVTSFFPLIVTIPFAWRAVEAASTVKQASSTQEPSQLLIQALFVFGASVLGWAARRLNTSWQEKRDNKSVKKVKVTTEQRIRNLEAQHSLEMRLQDQKMSRLQGDLDAANLSLLEMENQREIQEKAMQDLIMRLREQRSQEELVQVILKAILSLPSK